MTIPTFAGVSHISFSARDAEASAAWWHDVMGFEEYARVSGDDWFGIVLLHAPTSTLVEFQQHRPTMGSRSIRDAPGWITWDCASPTAAS